MAISTSLLPVISKSYTKKNIPYTKKKLFEAITLSLFVGIIFNILFITIPDILLKFIYNTDKGLPYIKIIWNSGLNGIMHVHVLH